MERSTNNYNWMSRIKRVFTQRIYLIEVNNYQKDSYLFKIMGNSDNSYEINIKKHADITCSCPDCKNGNLCKHILFLLIKVFRMTSHDIFLDYYKDDNFLLSPDTLPYCNAWYADHMREKELKLLIKKDIDDTDSCPICCELFFETKDEETVWCRESCGKSVHKSCFEKWSDSLGHNRVTCVYCRSPWNNDI